MGPRGPGGYFPPIFALFLGPGGLPWGGPGGAWGPLFLPIFLKADALWGAPPVQFTLVPLGVALRGTR